MRLGERRSDSLLGLLFLLPPVSTLVFSRLFRLGQFGLRSFQLLGKRSAGVAVIGRYGNHRLGMP